MGPIWCETGYADLRTLEHGLQTHPKLSENEPQVPVLLFQAIGLRDLAEI